MKLYIYDHCPFCARARMIFGLKALPFELVTVLENDAETPTRLVGKKTTPILEKADGSHMAESMDIVHTIDAQYGSPIVTPVADSAIKAWHDIAWKPVLNLSIPRLARGQFAELETPQAREAFRTRQTKNFGDLDALLARSPEMIQEMNGLLTQLDPLLQGRAHIDADDFLLYPVLRMLSIVKGIAYPTHVDAYMKRMEQSTGVSLHLNQAA